jgi:Fe-S cluster biosynthesis and repair protein YggX
MWVAGISFCTGLHRNAQGMETRPLAKNGRGEYSGNRLSREALKTCQHNQTRAQEPQGSCALNFFVRTLSHLL